MHAEHSQAVRGIRQELAERRLRAIDEARSMPPPYYTSAEFLEVEKRRIFGQDWICVGHAGEVSKPGDYFTTELVDEQLVVTRGQDDVIRVLSNVCRHRGNIVAMGAGNARRFVCGYHAWTYGVDGGLLFAPLMEANKTFDKATCGLPVFKTEIWNGFIFVNLDGKAEPLVPRLEKLDGQIRNYHIDDRTLLFSTEEVWQTNWKNLAENFMEGYHLSITHPKTLHPITPTSLCRKIEGNEYFTGYSAHYNPATPERGPYHPDLTREEQRQSPLYCVFPALVFAVAPHFTLYLCLRPAGVDRVAIRWGVAGVLADPNDPTVTSYVDLCKAFNAEDKAKLETLQRGLKTQFYQSGPLAPDPFEGTIWDIYHYFARKLGAGTVEQENGATAAGNNQ